MLGRILSLITVLALALEWVHAADHNNLTTLVTWDKYSLSINNSRVFLFAGEFHYQRLPVPELWPDIFQKFRAQGLNTVSIYFFWSYHSPAPGVYDFESGGKNVQKLLDAAKEAGLWVIARPGPYCNAETNAGGLALWTTGGGEGKLRTGDEGYRRAWSEWISRIGVILRRNQITEGGPIVLVQVENELQETVHQANHTLVIYMEQLKKALQDAGIVVPLIHNEKGMRSISWSTDYQNVGGAIDIYGLDSYPGGLSCTKSATGFKLVRNYHEWFGNYSYTQPGFMPEFEAGWFQPHGGDWYGDCREELGTEFADVYYKNNIGQRVTMLSLYMAYGGTSWGHSAAPVVYSSYDYSAPLSETRQIRDKFNQIKLLGLFLRVSEDLLKADLIGHGSNYANTTPAIWTWYLKNPNTESGFYVIQQTDSASRTSRKTAISIRTSNGSIGIPEVELDGRQSKIIVANYRINKHVKLLFSTAEVLTFGDFDRPVIVLYSKAGQRSDYAFAGNVSTKFKSYGSNDMRDAVKSASGHISWRQQAGYTTLDFEELENRPDSAAPLVYLMDLPSAWSFSASSTTQGPHVRPHQQIFIIGPYLVRSATIKDDTLHVLGDLDLEKNLGKIEAYVGIPRVKTISWNNKDLPTTKTPYGALIGQLPMVKRSSVELPTLETAEWRSADSLPEIGAQYDDAKWTVCNHTTSRSPVKPISLPILFSSEYGLYTGAKIYRGTFSSRTLSRINITASGGEAFGWNAWLNGHFLGGNVGQPGRRGSDGKIWEPGLGTTWTMLKISKDTIVDGNNVLTVLCDYHGHDQTSLGPHGPRNARGLLGVKLYDDRDQDLVMDQWRIAGNAGAGTGRNDSLDAVRGPMNEGGLYGERMGWHLPGFDTSAWTKASPRDGFRGAGVRWYSTTFDLKIGGMLDVPLGVELNAPKSAPARIQIFMNGYQYGKYIPHIGPQTRFSVPPGIININGANTLALSMWAQSEAGVSLSSIKLIRYGMYETTYDFGGNTAYLRPGWTSEREEYG